MSQRVKEYYQRDFRRDFFTAPELDRAFGYALAEHLTKLVKDFEKPVFLELGGGSGVLAYDILQYIREKETELYQRLKYYIYEFSPTLIDIQRKRLEDFIDKVFWCDSLFPFEGVVFSNEFFDCLPVHVLKEGRELFVEDGKEVWLEVKDQRLIEVIRRMGYEKVSQVLELCIDCIDFLRDISKNLIRGYHLLIDYGYTSEEMDRFPQGTVLGYSSHRVEKNLLRSVEPIDITAHVNFSLLEEYGRDFGLEKVYLKSLRDFLLESSVFVEEFYRLAESERAEDIERLSRLKTMLVSMGERFRVLLQKRL